MEASYCYFNNKDCKYFPCHQNIDPEEFNCLFCFCPMNAYIPCLGTPNTILSKKGQYIKDCSGCTYPHHPKNYKTILDFLSTHPVIIKEDE